MNALKLIKFLFGRLILFLIIKFMGIFCSKLVFLCPFS